MNIVVFVYGTIPLIEGFVETETSQVEYVSRFIINVQFSGIILSLREI